MAKLYIGMPVYNNESFVEKAIRSLQSQTFTNWSLHISDNASTDRTADICERIAYNDSRINVYRQASNIGAPNNFKFCLERADTPYFMWAAGDDVWEPTFVDNCLFVLEHNQEIDMVFSKIINIDSFDALVRKYPDFKQFEKVCRYVSSPEILGKANIIYSIYRSAYVKSVWRIYPLNNSWGSDMSFVVAALSRGRLKIIDKILFQKRIERHSDREGYPDLIQIKNPTQHIFPLKEFPSYLNNHIKAVRQTPYYWPVIIVLFIRLPRAIYNALILAVNRLNY